jgi:hypothetical protein
VENNKDYSSHFMQGKIKDRREEGKLLRTLGNGNQKI